jgi:ribonuclease D
MKVANKARSPRPQMSTRDDEVVRLIAPTKAETALLEPFLGLSLAGIHLPKTVEEVEQAGREIVASGIAGFDTESKPTFSTGEKSRGPHVVQFALRDRAFIFQLHRAECRDLVSDLLQSERVLKVGFGLRNDRGQIRSKLGVALRAIVDLDHVFRKRGYKGQIGVRAAVGAVLNQSFRKSKRVTTSNWAAPDLTPAQLLYAANDAFAALKVMEALGLGDPNAASFT